MVKSSTSSTVNPEIPDYSSGASREVVEKLFREHNQALVQFLRAHLGSDQDAYDVAQEAYVKLLQLDQPEKLSFLRAYLFKIALNLATDHRRRQTLWSSISQYLALFDFSTIGKEDEKIIMQQELEIVSDAIAELPLKCRKAFFLSRMENWSSSKIGLHMGLSDRMVRLYIVRAIEHIQYRLNEQG